MSKAVSLAKQGSTAQEHFTAEIPFRYVKDHLFVDVTINGQIYNFLFDTGFDFTVIDEKLFNQMDTDGKSLSVQTTGSSFSARNISYQPFEKITVAGIDFMDTGIGVTDLVFIQEDYECEFIVHGVLGANLMRKAIWQIDYQNLVIRFSDDIANLEVPDSSFPVPLSSKSWGNSRMSISLNGVSYDFLFDTGSSGRFTSGPALLEELKNATPDLPYLVTECASSSPDNPVFWEYDVVINELTLGDISLDSEIISLEKSVSALIGNLFLKDYLVTIDWSQNEVHLTPTAEYVERNVTGLGISLLLDVKREGIYISSKIVDSDIPSGIVAGAEVLKINDKILENLSKEELCDFMTVEWLALKTSDEIRLTIRNSSEEIHLKRKRFIPTGP